MTQALLNHHSRAGSGPPSTSGRTSVHPQHPPVQRWPGHCRQALHQRRWRTEAALQRLASTTNGPHGRPRQPPQQLPPAWASKLARATLVSLAAHFYCAAAGHAAGAASTGGGWGPGNGAGGGSGGGGGGDGQYSASGQPSSANVLADVAEASEQLVEEVVLLDVGGKAKSPCVPCGWGSACASQAQRTRVESMFTPYHACMHACMARGVCDKPAPSRYYMHRHRGCGRRTAQGLAWLHP